MMKLSILDAGRRHEGASTHTASPKGRAHTHLASEPEQMIRVTSGVFFFMILSVSEDYDFHKALTTPRMTFAAVECSQATPSLFDIQQERLLGPQN